jgi:hypothetical protein
MKCESLFPILVLLFCSCGTSLSVADGDILPPEKQLAKWYGEHLQGKGPLLDESRRDSWLFMFDADLKKVLEKGELGMDPFLFAQDAEIEDLSIQRIETGERPNALVLITFTNFGKRIELVAAMKITDHGWILLNIVKPDDGQSLI